MHICITKYKIIEVYMLVTLLLKLIFILCKRMRPCIDTCMPCACMHGTCRDQKTASDNPRYQKLVNNMSVGN